LFEDSASVNGDLRSGDHILADTPGASTNEFRCAVKDAKFDSTFMDYHTENAYVSPSTHSNTDAAPEL